ncbi:hypothetical protein FQN49_002303 [Arthroderma sp. PD_2]|nr:hypothetical protein FQN49_002303 [Arthroderma sp. PD_2]
MRDNLRVQSLLCTLLLLLPRDSHGLEVTVQSDCSSLCVDNVSVHTNYSDHIASNTYYTDLVCEDSQFVGSNSTEKGRKWVHCVGCQGGSDHSGPAPGNTETDVSFFLFHLRYNFAWCVYGWPNNTDILPVSSTCGQICNPIIKPVTTGLWNFSPSNTFKYCLDDDSSIETHASSCIECLEKAEDASIFANYVRALQVACEQKPATGKALDIDFDVFAIKPSTTMDASTGTTSATTTSTTSTTAEPRPSDGDSNKVKIGVGVSVGVGVAILLGAGIWLFLWRRRRSDTTNIPDNTTKTYFKTVSEQVQEMPGDKPNIPELGPVARWPPRELEAR